MNELKIPVYCDEPESQDKFYSVFEKLEFDINESVAVLRTGEDESL